jgi:hypothetical protein
MHRYCTLFDRNYLSRGLALHRSLMRHAGGFTLHVLCLDETVRSVLAALDLPRVEPVSLEDLVARDPELRAARAGRAPLAFYFACKPVLLGYLFERFPEAARLTYLDSDLYFFSAPSALEAACAGHPIALSPHRLTEWNAHFAKYGRFNAGWVSLGLEPEARRFLGWWRKQCLAWSDLAAEGARFGDQGYLDAVPGLFPGTLVVDHPGANAGPWNLDPRGVELSPDGVRIEGHPLVYFHFHNLRRLLFGLYESGLHSFGVELTPSIRRGIYRPYVRELASCERQIAPLRAPEPPLPGREKARLLTRTALSLARRTIVSAASSA